MRDKFLNYLSIGLFLLGVVCVGYVLFSNLYKKREQTKIGNVDCVPIVTSWEVNDNFMSGIANQGAHTKLYKNFYNCNEPSVGDYVWFKISEHVEPVMREIQGVPGDKYALLQDSKNKKRWTLLINGRAATSSGKNYYIESNTVPPLKTYEIHRGGVLKKDEYIILSHVTPGMTDSSNLGLISKKSFAGRIVIE